MPILPGLHGWVRRWYSALLPRHSSSHPMHGLALSFLDGFSVAKLKGTVRPLCTGKYPHCDFWALDCDPREMQTDDKSTQPPTASHTANWDGWILPRSWLHGYIGCQRNLWHEIGWEPLACITESTRNLGASWHLHWKEVACGLQSDFPVLCTRSGFQWETSDNTV